MTVSDDIKLTPIPRGDEVYATLMEAHQGLSDAQSAALNARLILILAAEIGDPDRLDALIHLAAGIESNQTAS